VTRLINSGVELCVRTSKGDLIVRFPSCVRFMYYRIFKKSGMYIAKEQMDPDLEFVCSVKIPQDIVIK